MKINGVFPLLDLQFMENTEKEMDQLESFLYHHGEELIGFGKYAGMKYKDVPETYVYWNYRANGTNARAREYGRIFVQKKK